MLDEVWFQRRIELWGEGFSYTDWSPPAEGYRPPWRRIPRRGCIQHRGQRSHPSSFPIPQRRDGRQPCDTAANQNPSGEVMAIVGADAEADPYWYKARN